MKNFFLSMLLVLVALTSAKAVTPRQPILLIKRSSHVVAPRPEQPGTNPLSVIEDNDFLELSAELTENAILLRASAATFVQVSIETEDGIIIYCQPEFLDNQPQEISTESWNEGTYLIYIEQGTNIYEGYFDL